MARKSYEKRRIIPGTLGGVGCGLYCAAGNGVDTGKKMPDPEKP